MKESWDRLVSATRARWEQSAEARHKVASRVSHVSERAADTASKKAREAYSSTSQQASSYTNKFKTVAKEQWQTGQERAADRAAHATQKAGKMSQDVGAFAKRKGAEAFERLKSNETLRKSAEKVKTTGETAADQFRQGFTDGRTYTGKVVREAAETARQKVSGAVEGSVDHGRKAIEDRMSSVKQNVAGRLRAGFEARREWERKFKRQFIALFCGGLFAYGLGQSLPRELFRWLGRGPTQPSAETSGAGRSGDSDDERRAGGCAADDGKSEEKQKGATTSYGEKQE